MNKLIKKEIVDIVNDQTRSVNSFIGDTGKNHFPIMINNLVDLVEKKLKKRDKQIKQSILKAIMDEVPKKLPDPNPYGKWVSIKNANKIIYEFESVIKEVLGEQKKVKGKFMPYNPNNY